MSGDQKPPPYSLPKWKKIPQLDEKGSGGAKDTITAVVLEATTKEIKDLFLKVKVDSSYESNYKILKEHDVKLLHEALSYLEINPNGLTKEGVCYTILKILYS